MQHKGRIQDFWKEGVPNKRTDRTSTPVGTGGEVEKKCYFKVNLHNLVHCSCLRHPHKVMRYISSNRPHLPLKPAKSTDLSTAGWSHCGERCYYHQNWPIYLLTPLEVTYGSIQSYSTHSHAHTLQNHTRDLLLIRPVARINFRGVQDP